MNDPVYQLSNRQKKELLIRGRAIEVAIPATPALCGLDDPYNADLRDWAAARLEGVDREYIKRAELIDVVVEPPTRGEGLTAILGVITEAAPHRLQLVISIVAVELCAIARPRHAPAPLAWPATARVGGVTLPSRSTRADEP